MYCSKTIVCQFIFPTVVTFLVWTGGIHSVSLHAQNTVSNPSVCGLGLPIVDDNCPDNGVLFNPNQYTIDVDNAPGTALGVDVFLKEVQLIIQHGWVGDLDISLISPAGKVLEVSTDNGQGEDNYGRFSTSGCVEYTSFAVGACTPVEEGEAPFLEGPYAPEQSFLQFNDGVTNPNGDWILQLCDDVGEDAGTLEFINLVFEPLSCLPIEDVQVTGVDSTTVFLDWDHDPNDCGTTIVEYGLPGFVPGTGSGPGQGQVFNAGCPPLVVTGLVENTTYDIYVRRSCAPGSFSINSCVVQATTGCQPPPMTIAETFATEEICETSCGAVCPLNGSWQNSVIDDFDWLVNSGETPTAGSGPPADANGDGRYVYLETSGSTCNNGTSEAILISGCIRIDKQGADTCHMSFNYHMFGPDIGRLELEATRDGGENWLPLWSAAGNRGNEWRKTYLSLSDFNDGEVVQFRFIGKGGAGSKGDIALDNIVFFGSETVETAFNQFFVDLDNDGFGDPERYFFSCLADPPAGFVLDDTDCDDSNPMVNPAMPEIPCDNIDNNCNAAILDDEAFLLPPEVTNDTICSDQQAMICAAPSSDNLVFWYGSPDGTDFIDLGNCLTPTLPPNTSSLPVIHRFYAEEVALGCGSANRVEVVVVVNPNPELLIPGGPEVCPGESVNLNDLDIQETNFTGAAITFHDASPTAPENQLTTNSVTLNGTTNYYVRAEGSGGCVDEILLPVTVKAGPSLTLDPADSISVCKDGFTSLTVNPTGGTGNYSYLWSTGEETPTIEVNSSFLGGTTDSYTVRVTDVTGCFSEDTVFVTTTTSIDSLRRRVTDVTDCGGNDGAIGLTPLNGIAPFNYSWSSSNGQSGNNSGIDGTFDLTGLTQAAYRITITDSSTDPCELILRSVLVNGPDAEVMTPSIEPVTCLGAGDGKICLNVDGDDLAYQWSTGDTTQCIENLVGGTYSVTVTEGVCETILDNLLVEEPEALKALFQPTEPTCAGENDGLIGLTVFGGTEPYTYQWSNGSVEESPAGLTAGTYLVTIEDANGCILTDSMELSEPETLGIELQQQENMSCTGIADGLLQVNGTGGISPYRYLWSTGSNSALVAGLSANTYPVQVTDLNGCTVTAIYEVQEPDPIRADLLSFTAPDCIGDTTGSIILRAEGGTADYQFAWNNGARDSILTGIGVGEYVAVVSDAENCPADTVAITLSAISELDVVAGVSSPQCVGVADGSITLTPSGLGPFSYQWERGDVSDVLTGVGVGDYGVVIQDAQGCILDTVFTVAAPQVFEVEVGLRSPSCFDGDDGVINVNLLQAGPAPLSFQWSNGSSSQSLVGIPAGAYVLSVTDGDQCAFVSDTLTIANPPRLGLQVDGVGEIKCFGDSTGFIEVSFEGGVEPYQISWNGVSRQREDLFDLPAGTYRLQMEDANECPVDTTFQLRQPRELVAEVDIQTGGVCEQSTSDRLVGSGRGGVGPYLYSWNNGIVESVIDQPETGDYELYLEDANGCTDTLESIKLKSRVNPLQLDRFFVSDVSCAGVNDASMTAIVSGGSGSLRYHFSNNFILNTDADSVTTTEVVLNQNYRVTVTDLQTGCVVVSSFDRADEPPALNLRRDSLQQVECFGEAEGAIFTSAVGGTPPYRYEWLDADEVLVDTVPDLLNVPEGSYRVRLTDFNGCTDSLQATSIISETPPIALVDSLTRVGEVECKGSNSGFVDIVVTGGRGPYSYAWSNGDEQATLSSVPAGSYQVTVTDAVDCPVTFPVFVVGEPEAAVDINLSKTDIDCAGMAVGRLEAEVSGGSPPYRLTWTSGRTILGAESASVLDSLSAGVYTLLVRDTNDCVALDSAMVQQPDSLLLSFDLDERSLMAVVEGGTPPYTYRWNNGSTDSAIDDLPDGEYRVEVTDLNGCIIEGSTLLVEALNRREVNRFSLYPNPVLETLFIDLELRRRSNLEVGIYDLSGRMLRQRQFSGFSAGQIRLDMNEWEAGLYIMQVQSGQEIYVREKIIKH